MQVTGEVIKISDMEEAKNIDNEDLVIIQKKDGSTMNMSYGDFVGKKMKTAEQNIEDLQKTPVTTVFVEHTIKSNSVFDNEVMVRYTNQTTTVFLKILYDDYNYINNEFIIKFYNTDNSTGIFSDGTTSLAFFNLIINGLTGIIPTRKIILSDEDVSYPIIENIVYSGDFEFEFRGWNSKHKPNLIQL